MASAAAGPARPGEGQPAIVQIPLDNLIPSPFNARKHFDRQALAELAASIKTDGIIEPLIVRKKTEGKDYEIISGERRFRAAELVELKAVPCIVREADEARARRLQIIENLQREGISPLEEAESFQDLLKSKGDLNSVDGEPKTSVTVEALAKELGKSKEYVYGRLKLLKLGKAAKKSLELGRITAGHAVELVPLDEAKQEKALDYLEADAGNDGVTHTSVMELREEIKYQINPPPKPAKSVAQSAEDKKFRERQERERKEHERRAEAQRKQQAQDKLVDARCLALLWPKLKTADAKTRETLIDNAIMRAVHERYLPEAMLRAEGKPVPEGWINSEPYVKRFQKLPRAERLALFEMCATLGNLGWNHKENEPTWKWAKIDRKKIAADVAREAKASAAGKTAVSAPVSTSAKSKPAKAKSPRTGARKAKAARGKAKRKS